MTMHSCVSLISTVPLIGKLGSPDSLNETMAGESPTIYPKGSWRAWCLGRGANCGQAGHSCPCCVRYGTCFRGDGPTTPYWLLAP